MMRAFAYVAFAVAALAALTALASGPGHRFGLWDYGFGFTLLRIAAWAGVAGALTFGVPWMQLRQARSVPPIHDITTETRQPPEFVALLQTRRAAPNGAEYGGGQVAEAQHRGYPDIAPLTYAAPPAAAFERCLDAARALGIARGPQRPRRQCAAHPGVLPRAGASTLNRRK